MKIDRKDLDKLREIIEGESKKIVLLSHTNPDGDAIGSSLAWGAVLQKFGHDVTCVVPNRYPGFLDWMDGISQVRIYKDDSTGETARKIAEADVIFCMDFNMISRLEKLGEAVLLNKDAKLILIDHHLDPPADYYISFSYKESSSTSFLVYKIIEELYGLEVITRSMGESLYVGMMTDTGNFSYSNLTAELFRAVAVLVEKGVDVAYVNNRVYNNFTADRVKLLGYALNKMEIISADNNQVAYITLRESELRRFNFQQGDSEGFVNYPLTIRGLAMSVIFIETKHFIRVSLRSRHPVDVSLFAKLYFDGGGHKNASGGKSYLNMEETIEYFRKSANDFFTKYPSGADLDSPESPDYGM